MAKELQMNYNTLFAKIRDESKFSLDEAVAIKQHPSESMPIEELFKDE